MFKRKVVDDFNWVELAMALPIGREVRGYHCCAPAKGKTNMVYGRESDYVWMKCHRCQEGKRKPVTRAPLRAPAELPDKRPTDVVRLVNVIAEHAHQLLKPLQNAGLIPYIASLDASPRYGRVYMPDQMNNYCGLDYTGKSFLRWHSPTGVLAAGYTQPGLVNVTIVDSAAEYMRRYRAGTSVVFIPKADRRTVHAVTTWLLTRGVDSVVIERHPMASVLRRELAVLGRVQLIGD